MRRTLRMTRVRTTLSTGLLHAYWVRYLDKKDCLILQKQREFVWVFFGFLKRESLEKKTQKTKKTQKKPKLKRFDPFENTPSMAPKKTHQKIPEETLEKPKITPQKIPQKTLNKPKENPKPPPKIPQKNSKIPKSTPQNTLKNRKK